MVSGYVSVMNVYAPSFIHGMRIREVYALLSAQCVRYLVCIRENRPTQKKSEALAKKMHKHLELKTTTITTTTFL